MDAYKLLNARLDHFQDLKIASLNCFQLKKIINVFIELFPGGGIRFAGCLADHQRLVENRRFPSLSSSSG